MKHSRFLVMIVCLSFLFVTACSTAGDQTEETTTQATATTTTQAVTTTKAQTTTTAQTTQQTTAAENPFEKFFEISWLVRYTENYEEGRWDELELEEKFNIDLKVWTLDAYNSEQINMMLAAGDFPDVGWIYYRQPYELYNEKLSRSVSLDMIKKYFPSFYGLLEAVPIGYKLNLIPGTTDQYYGLSYIYGMNNYFYNINGFRLDWLENMGFEFDDLVPFHSEYFGEKYENSIFFSDRVITFEELQEIYKFFTEDDPDGNGADDTVGAILLWDSYGHWSNISQAMFGYTASSDRVFKDPLTGDYVPYYAYSGMRDFLAWGADMLEKGWMRKLPGQESWYNELNALWNQGLVGHMYMDAGDTYDTAAGYFDSVVPYTLREHSPESSIVIVPAVLGPDGIGGNCRYMPLPWGDGPWRTWVFGYEVSDEKLARIFQLLEYTHFDTEAFYRYFYGIEGVHFKWLGEKGKSAILKIETEKIPAQYRSGTTPQHIFATDKFLADFLTWSQKTEFLYALGKFQLDHGWFEKYVIEPGKLISAMYMGIDMYEQHEKKRTEVQPQLDQIRNDFRNRVLNGEVANINAEWEQYISQLYAAGLEDLVNDFYNNDAFEVFVPYRLYEFKR
jgi:putative aldouronate transport system substrate-binding protein